MNEKTLLIQSGKKLLHEGFTVETWGNISLRGADGLVYITPSGMDYDTCTEEDIVVMDLEGHVVEGSRVPSIEHGLHRAVYAARPEVNAIVHTHPIYSTVFSAMGDATRQKILLLFEPGEHISLSTLVSIVGMSRTAVSHHVNVLVRAGLLVPQRTGKEVFYRRDLPYTLEMLDRVRDYALAELAGEEGGPR